MPKLNPLHIEGILNGVDPSTVDPSSGVGWTTAEALSLLARCQQQPGKALTPNAEDYNESMDIIRRALAIASRAELRHFYEGRTRGTLIWEYRQPNSMSTKGSL